MKVIAFCGSLRKESINRMLLNYVSSVAPDSVDVEIVESVEMPLFNEDFEKVETPKLASDIASKIAEADAVIIATPEYNRSIPGGLKNMLDWLSRGELVNCWRRKKVAVMGASSGNLGTVSAQHDLKKILLYFGSNVMGTPEFYVGQNKSKFNEKGELLDEKTKEFVVKFWGEFINFIGK
jgi:chromate reductase